MRIGNECPYSVWCPLRVLVDLIGSFLHTLRPQEREYSTLAQGEEDICEGYTGVSGPGRHVGGRTGAQRTPTGTRTFIADGALTDAKRRAQEECLRDRALNCDRLSSRHRHRRREDALAFCLLQFGESTSVAQGTTLKYESSKRPHFG